MAYTPGVAVPCKEIEADNELAYKYTNKANLVAAITAGKQGDDATAFAHWQTLAEAGDAEAQLTLGLLHYQGDGTAQDSTQARVWLEKAAAQNNATAQYMLGVLYQRGEGGAQDHAKARTWLEKAAAQGHAQAQYNLGVLYENGQGITRDYDKARAWYEKVAAQTGDQEAQQAQHAGRLSGRHQPLHHPIAGPQEGA